MKMLDWINQLDYFIKMNRKDLLDGKELVTHEEAIEHAKQEYEKYRKRMLIDPTEKEKDYFAKFNTLLNYTKKDD